MVNRMKAAAARAVRVKAKKRGVGVVSLILDVVSEKNANFQVVVGDELLELVHRSRSAFQCRVAVQY